MSTTSQTNLPNLLGDGWTLIARMSDSDSGMFNGDTNNFQPNYAYGTFNNDPLSKSDYYRPFFVANAASTEILFITGNLQYWARVTLDKIYEAGKVETGEPNLNWVVKLPQNASEQLVTGNLLFRSSLTEDPWITLVGGHDAYGGLIIRVSLIIKVPIRPLRMQIRA